MPTLIKPTEAQIADCVRHEMIFQNSRKRSVNRMLDIDTAPQIAAAVAAKPAGAIDVNGGTQASYYPATTVALAVAWFTRFDGVKVVRVRAKRIRLNAATDVPAAPYAAGAYSDGLIAAGGFVCVVSDALAGIYGGLKDSGLPLCEAVYVNPGDLTAWLALADWWQENDVPGMANIIRNVVAGTPVPAE